MNSRRSMACSVREGLGNGYLTVFLTLILTVMLSFSMTLIVSAGENTRRFAAECVTDIGMNSILAEYHRELLEQYNVFFTDISYGTQVIAYENMTEHLKNYINHNLQGDDLFMQGVYGNLIHMELDNIAVNGALSACEEGGISLRRQAVDAIKQDVGITYLEKTGEWLATLQSSGIMDINLLEKQKEAEKKVVELTGKKMGTLFEEEEQEDNAVTFYEAGILNLVADREELSAREITLSQYASHRVHFESGGLSVPESYADDFWDELFFHEYIMSYTGHYGEKNSGSAYEKNFGLAYETEYLLAGKAKDIDNLKAVAGQILAIRGGANLIALMQDEGKKQYVQILAFSMASLLGIPEAEEVLEELLKIIWAMAEALYDVTILLQGGRIPVIKQPEEWHYSMENAINFVRPETGQTKITDGLSYEDYLRILLCFHGKEELTMRMADVMEMNIRNTPGNENFCMDGCFESFRVQIVYRGERDKKYTIDRTYGY
jgi:hypothetical protein